MDETISLLVAVQQEITVRRFFQMILICCGILIMLVAISSFFGLTLPVGLLSIMLLIYFFVINKKEISRLCDKYVRK